MNKSSPKNMVARRGKSKIEQADSPSRDSDSVCDSEASSPVPFLCTQDGAEGETDVVWNFYTPKSENAVKSRFKNSTPLSSKTKKASKHKLLERQLPKRRALRSTQKQTELFQELLELNQNLPELIKRKKIDILDKPKSESEDDIFSDANDHSPKSVHRNSSNCLRRNVLSSKFAKIDSDTALESDDSMNECLLKASQVVEENILHNEPVTKRCTDISTLDIKPGFNIQMDNDSMDAILNSIKFDSPILNKVKKCESPCLNNDSFDNLVGNLNDSVLERLTQIPCKNKTPNRKAKTDWMIRELVVHDGSPSSKSVLSRYNSMPESPTVDSNKPSTSGMSFGRHNSMPYQNTELDDSPIRCTPDEIKRKHQQAREKLLAKRLLPFTSSQITTEPIATQGQQSTQKKIQFKPKVPSSVIKNVVNQESKTNKTDLKSLIEKKRQEALMKLRRRLPN